MNEAEKKERLALLKKVYEERRTGKMANKSVEGVCDACGKQARLRKVNGWMCCATCEHVTRAAKNKPELVEKIMKEIAGRHPADEYIGHLERIGELLDLDPVDLGMGTVLAVERLKKEVDGYRQAEAPGDRDTRKEKVYAIAWQLAGKVMRGEITGMNWDDIDKIRELEEMRP